jgi:hypothetical protein
VHYMTDYMAVILHVKGYRNRMTHIKFVLDNVDTCKEMEINVHCVIGCPFIRNAIRDICNNYRGISLLSCAQ